MDRDRKSPAVPPFPPRLLSKPQLAAYLGLTLRGPDRWRKDGRVPKPLPGTARWDRVAVDSMIDDLSKLSILKTPKPAPPEEEADPLAKWRNRIKDERANRGRKAS